MSFRRVMVGALMAGTNLVAAPAFAQDSGAAAEDTVRDSANSGEMDIVVTAQKRDERLSDVPLSITASTGDQLSVRGISDPADLGKLVPGFAFQRSAYSTPIYQIRGVGFYENSVTVSPTVSVYVDQIPLPYSVMAAGTGLDVERVEVLKGPQGTLFGQNSTGGAINYIAAKPTSELSYGGQLTYGRFNQFDAEAFLSGPISDTLRARVAVRSEQRGDWQKSQTRPGDTLGQRDFLTGRLLLDWEPVDGVKFEFSANGWRDKSDTMGLQFRRFTPNVPLEAGARPDAYLALTGFPTAPRKPRIADWDDGFDFVRDDHFYQFALRGDIDLTDLITLTSISSYASYRQNALIDGDGSFHQDVNLRMRSDIETVSQELRVAGSDASEALRWMVGGNYQYEKTLDNQIGDYRGTNQMVLGNPFETFDINTDQVINTYAVFGGLDYDITDNLTIQGSMRYTKQDRDRTGCLFDGGDGRLATAFAALSSFATGANVTIAPGACVTLSDTTNLPVGLVNKQLNEDNLSWRVSLNWKPGGRDTLIYGNITRGYKAGGFPTLPDTKEASSTPVSQESILAYELGLKTSAFDRTLQLNGALFYYDYTGKQLLGVIDSGFPFGALPALVQVPKSDVKGVELDIKWRPVDNWSISLGGTYVESEVKSSYITPDPLNVPVNIQGEAFPNTPKWQLIGDTQYDIPLSGNLSGFVGGSFSYRSTSNAAFGQLEDFVLPAYTTIDLRAGIEDEDGRWRAMVWGRNITNKYYLNGVARILDTVAAATGMPATYGITLSYRY